jgi:hypothetical protein
MEHLGVKVELFGRIEMFYDRGGSYDFVSLVRELEPAGVVYDSKEFKFSFDAVEKPYESYRGLNVSAVAKSGAEAKLGECIWESFLCAFLIVACSVYTRARARFHALSLFSHNAVSLSHTHN